MPRSAQDRTACATSAFVGALSLCPIIETMFIRPACVRVSSVTSLMKPINVSPRNAPIKMLLSGNVASSSCTAWMFFRSEEHTSELQSRENLVCRLLLEKKKNEGDQHRND